MKEFEIWIGYYHYGTGYIPPSKPKLLGKIKAPNFKIACLLYELRTMLHGIEENIERGYNINEQSCRWFYDYDKNRNAWTGRYYWSEQEAMQSFKEDGKQ